MYKAGAARLAQHAQQVDALNVFPVPDGDTGTNMNLTFTSGVAELEKSAEQTAEKVASVFSRGLLMGARGNSGVILSQLFRGIAKGLTGLVEADARQVADAFQQGVDMAYKAVMKPVEGTILTVAREAAAAARKAARGTVEEVVEALVAAGQRALDNTPNQLPVLKEVGVVDSGGQGLVYIYEGFLQALNEGITFEKRDVDNKPQAPSGAAIFGETHEEMHHVINPADIVYGYCTEFMVHLREMDGFRMEAFRDRISQYGDSLLVVADDDLIKVHIHAEEPGDVLSFAHKYGPLDRIKIENMRLQHEAVLRRQEVKQVTASSVFPDVVPPLDFVVEPEVARERYGIIAVASGAGIAEIFRSLGVGTIIEGGQTMNPSTEQFVQAIEASGASNVIILPNNKNIVMAAKQAAELVDIPVAVIPAVSVPQGMSAMLAFAPEAELAHNEAGMIEAVSLVKTGLVTYAVRDTKLDEIDIKEGDFIGIQDGEIVVAGVDMYEVATNLVTHMVEGDDELITVLYGSDPTEAKLDAWEKHIRETYSSYEVEMHEGGQPLYAFIIAVE
nr:DAK2 domain-containing protein [Aneurinibacillus soli]